MKQLRIVFKQLVKLGEEIRLGGRVYVVRTKTATDDGWYVTAERVR